MSNKPLDRTVFNFQRHRLALSDLKRCPLCESVNSRYNRECFVCRWHGDFDYDAGRIQAGLVDLIERCPDLIEMLPVTDSFPVRFVKAVKSLFRRRVDIEA